MNNLTRSSAVLSFSVIAALGACDVPNPNFCCTDEANCASVGVPISQMCTGGLICRGNQCIAEPCTTANDCEASVPFCGGDSLCTATCDDSSQCPGFGGDAADTICSNGVCVECLMSTDCTVAAPVCDNGACRACGLDAECPSNVCGDDGACLADAAVIYVDPVGVDAGTCTQAAPCKTLGFAATQAADSRFAISISPGQYQDTFAIDSTTTSASKLDLHGHGAAFVSSADSDAYDLFVSARVRDLTFDGGGSRTTLGLAPNEIYELDRVEITGSAVGLDSEGTVTAHSLTIHDTGIAVLFRGSLTVDGAVIRDSGSGLKVAGIEAGTLGTLQMSNVMMFNFTEGLALDLTKIAGTVSFSTIVSALPNKTTSPQTVKCIDNATVSSSIIFAPGASGTPITGCNLAASIVGPTAVVGASNSDPQFVNPGSGDFHLKATSPAIDMVNTGPATDFEGDARPQGARFDIGADELKP